MTRFAILIPLLIAACGSTPPPADPGDPIDWADNQDKLGPEAPDDSSWTDLFVDEQDGAFDVSNWLATPAGFFPMVVPLTEPALGVGLAGGAVFFHRSKDEKFATESPPSMSFAAGGGTSNGTWFVGAGSAADNFGGLSDAKLIVSYGGGIRYLIARKLGIWFGLDYARGPETEAVYITFGNAWPF